MIDTKAFIFLARVALPLLIFAWGVLIVHILHRKYR